MSNENWFYKVDLKIWSTPKRCKKVKFQIVNVGRVEFKDGDLSPFIEKAAEMLKGFNKVERAKLCLNKAKEGGDMVFVTLLSEKEIELL